MDAPLLTDENIQRAIESIAIAFGWQMNECEDEERLSAERDFCIGIIKAAKALPADSKI